MAVISVVLTTRNSEAWLIEALDSIRAQTHPRERLETIVVDNSEGESAHDIARSYLVRHAMRGEVLAGNGGLDVPSSMNVGWQAASGDWIQFCTGSDILAPTKIAEQNRCIPELPAAVGVLLASWQSLRPAGDQWLLAEPVHCPRLGDGVPLGLLAQPQHLGAALVRRTALEAVAGFSEDTDHALAEHLLVKIAGMGGDAPLLASAFAAVASPLPLFFAREVLGRRSRRRNVATLRQHLENILAARALLLRHELLTGDELALASQLCGACLADLRGLDRAAFRQGTRRLEQIDARLLPDGAATPSRALQPALRRRLKVRAPALSWRARTSLVGAGTDLPQLPAPPAARLATIAASGIAAAVAPATDVAQRVMFPLQRLRQRRAEMRAMREAYPEVFFVPGASARRWKVAAAMGAALAVAALVGTVLALDPLATGESPGEAPARQPVTARLGMAPIIVVASTIHVEPASRWPMPIAIGPPRSLPPEGFLQIRGLPRAASLSQGRNVASGVWAVPLALASHLEVEVPAETSGRAELTLAVHGGDGRVLAEARTALSVTGLPAASAPPPPAAARALEAAREARAGKEVAAGSVQTPGAVVAKTAAAETRALAGAGAASPPTRPADGADASRLSATAGEPARPEAGALPLPLSGAARAVRAPTTAAEAERAAWMIARGERDLADGNVAMARQFFLRAAEAGFARGAFLLASTYDAHEFARLRIQGVQPNARMARLWYRRARELGADEADASLARLGAGD
jgi:glycosyltransferase involved in cell wall biosynthesis